MNLNKIKHQVYINLEPSASLGSFSLANRLICFFIFLSFLNAILQTEATIANEYQDYFIFCEKVFFYVFLIEYILRLWISDIYEVYKKYQYKRLKYLTSFYAMLDLITLVVFVIPYFASSPALLRMLRLVKILRVIKFGRFSRAISRLKYALGSRAPDLILTISVALIIMIFAATLLYFIEGKGNPDAFGSIPRALWWAVITLTTVGYGDVVPTTMLGKAAAGFIAVIGLGLIAMPAGILAAAFSDAMTIERRVERKDKAKKEKKELSEKKPKKEKNT